MPIARPLPNDIYTVTRLNRSVRTVLEEVFPTIWVQGEISNLTKPLSGHLYFTLKDSTAQIRCAMFKNRQSGLRFDPKNGALVLAHANVSLYEGYGEYQLIIKSLEPSGAGALQLTFERLKQKLSKAGLFDESCKKPIPRFPETIGIITSATGAAIWDILNVLKRRYPCGNVIIYPVPVQGEDAANKIVEAIRVADKRKECNVLILSRGGGSLENLWSFNEETVAHAIHVCTTPLVCGIGHETDFTIADFVADQRAPTPSVAAELVSPDSHKLLMSLRRYQEQIIRLQQKELINYRQFVIMLSKQIPHPKQQLQQRIQQVDKYSLRLTHHIEKQMINKKICLTECASKIEKQYPLEIIKQHSQLINTLKTQLEESIQRILTHSRQKTLQLTQILETISPASTLERGYAIVTDKDSGKIIRHTSETSIGNQLRIFLAKAEIDSIINDIHEK